MSKATIPTDNIRLSFFKNALGKKQTLHNEFEKLYNNKKGDWPAIQKALEKNKSFSAAEVSNLIFTHELANWTGENKILVSHFQNNANTNSLRDIAMTYGKNDIKKLVTGSAIPTGQIKATYADNLYNGLYTAEPTAVIGNMLKDPDVPLGNKETGKYLGEILKKAPEFNIKTTSVYEVINNKSLFKDIPKEIKAQVIKDIKTLQRITLISPVPEAVPALINKNYVSAYNITQLPIAQFIATMKGTDLPDETLSHIYAEAANKKIINEQNLIKIKEAGERTGIKILDGDLPVKSDNTGANTVDPDVQAILTKNNLNWDLLFGDADFCECNECTSVYGATAYYVDLLQYLRNNNLDPANPNTGKGIQNTPLEKLLSRRPDLGHLELTCKNTNTIMPYVDLVNEVMEQYIAFKLKPDDFKNYTGFNVGDETSGELLSAPQHMEQEKAYQALMIALFPFSLPYHQAIDAARIFLKHLNSSRYELINTFRENNVNINYDCAADAEFLGLTEEEYGILTKKNFIGSDILHNINECYGLLTTYPLSKLSQVKNEFLPRTGILYTDLIELLQTQFINPPSTTGSKNIDLSNTDTCNLDDVRLNVGSAQQAEGIYDIIHRFIRLWRKSGFTMDETDKVIMALGNGDITPELIHQLVAVRKIMDLTGIELTRLLCFWGNIGTVGDNSLYKNLFLSHNVLGIDQVFEADSNGNYLSGNAKISEHIPVLMAALNLSAGDIEAIRTAATMNDELTINNLSVLYRYRLLSKVLGLRIPAFISILPLFGNVFQDAGTTVEFMERWTKMEDAGFLYQQLNYIILGVDDEKKPFAPSQLAILQLSKNLYDSLNAIDNAHHDLMPDATITDPALKIINVQEQATTELIRAKASLLFDAGVVEKIIGLLEGINVFTTNAPDNLTLTITDETLKKKLKYYKTPGSVQITGILTQAESNDYNTLSNDPDWNATLTRIQKQQNKLFKELLSGIFESEKTKSDAEKAQLETIITAGDINIPLSQIPNGQADTNTAPQKRAAFLEIFLPYLRQELTRRFIADTLSSFAGLESKITSALVTEVLKIGTPAQAIYSIFEKIRESTKPVENNWSGYLVPDFAGTYTFIIKNSTSKPVFRIDGTLLDFTVQEEPADEWWSSNFNLQAGKLYKLVAEATELKNIYWKATASAIGPIPSSVLIPDFAYQQCEPALIDLKKASMLVSIFDLSADEIKFLDIHKVNFDNVDFNSLTLIQWLRLEAYTRLRNSLQQVDLNILDFWNWIYNTADPAKLSEKIADLTTWKKECIDQLITSDHFNISNPSDYQNEKNLLKISESLTVANKIGMDIDLLFGWAIPTSDFTTCRNIADSIQKAIRPHYNQTDWEEVVKPMNDQLRNNQKNALIAYLLQQPELKTAGVTEAEGLFEYFLIDVQMDPCMETSRIKQAISSVQLFIQRCFLGLEDGIDVNLLDRKRWEWMEVYRVWEANRKVFLYPENWIESNLRDDKSAFFKELESELLQKDINDQNVSDALKSYLYKVAEVANMEVVGLYIEGEMVDDFTWKNGAKLHVFSRTHNAPYIFYYRYLALDELNWYPWEKMQVDIPSYDVEDTNGQITGNGCYLTPVVWNGRLLVFIPQFMKKTKPNPGASDTIEALSKVNQNKLSPIDYWEIKMAWSDYRNGKWTQKQLGKDPMYHLGLTSDLTSLKDAVTNAQKKVDDLQTKPDGLLGIMNDAYQAWDDIEYPTPNSHGAISKAKMDAYKIKKKAAYDNYLAAKKDYDKSVTDLNNAKTDLTNAITAMDAAQNGVLVIPGAISAFKFVPVPSGDNTLLAIKVYYNKETTELGMFEFNGIHLQAPVQTYSGYNPGYVSYFHYVGVYQHASIGSLQINGPVGYLFRRNLGDVYYTNIKFYHFFIKNLLGIINAEKPEEFFMFNLSIGTTQEDAQIIQADIDDAFGNSPRNKGKQFYHELERPYSLYNWEIFFHTPIMLADALCKAQQFEIAMKWFHYVFNPLAEGTDDKRFWQFLPFKQVDSKSILEQIFNNLQPNTPDTAINEWRNNPFKPHLIARSRPVAYMKWVVMKYIDNILDWGDYLFRQDTIESINQATQLYILAGHILGPKPMMIPKRGEPIVQTYLSLLDKWDAFSNAMSELEVTVINNTQTSDTQNGDTNETPSTDVVGSVNSLYFCLPKNQNLMGYWDTLADRLFKIRHCQNIEGVFRMLPLFEPPIDPALLVKAAAQGLSISSVVNDMNSIMPNYRFYYLLQKSLELCNELKSLGGAMLSAIEKKDNEAISVIRARHESALNNLMMEIKKLQLEEAQKTLESLEQNRVAPEERMRYYLELGGLGEDLIPGNDAEFKGLPNTIEQPVDESGLKLNAFEKEDMDKSHEARILQIEIGQKELLASILHLLPTASLDGKPFGIGVGIQFGGPFLGGAMEAWAKSLQNDANGKTYMSTNASKKGGFQRALQERIFQVNAAGYELKQIDKQITAQQIRIDITNQEIINQQKQIDNANEIEEFLKNKYTNEELYTWMRGSLKTLYRQVYNLAFDLARKAEKTYCFERGMDNSGFIQQGYFDAGREGLLAGEQLYAGLKQLEAAYQEKKGYDYEITRHISLRYIDPLALLQLKATCISEFDLPEVLFDMDFPGQFKRRIKSVSVSIPCVAGPYTGVNATLRLLNNKFRNSSIANNYPEKTDEEDDRFISYNIPIMAIATSSGQNDPGMFELNFRDERYLPFEGAGVISRWRLELPTIRQFDYDTITDVVLHIKYTASEGGEQLKKSAKASVALQINQINQQFNETGLHIPMSMKHDMPNDWNLLQKNGIVNIIIDHNRLPYMSSVITNATVSLLFISKIKILRLRSDINPGIDINFNQIPGVDLFKSDEIIISIGSVFKLYGYKNGIIPSTVVTNNEVDNTELLLLDDLVMVVKYKLSNP